MVEVELDVRGNCVTASPNTAVASNTAVGETGCVGVGRGVVRALACAARSSVGSVGLYACASDWRLHEISILSWKMVAVVKRLG